MKEGDGPEDKGVDTSETDWLRSTSTPLGWDIRSPLLRRKVLLLTLDEDLLVKKKKRGPEIVVV